MKKILGILLLATFAWQKITSEDDDVERFKDLIKRGPAFQPVYGIKEIDGETEFGGPAGHTFKFEAGGGFEGGEKINISNGEIEGEVVAIDGGGLEIGGIGGEAEGGFVGEFDIKLSGGVNWGISGIFDSLGNIGGGGGGGSNLTQGLTSFLESPIRFFLGANGEGGIVGQIEAQLKAISGAQIGETIGSILQSPFLVAEQFSGGIGETVSGIIATVISPVPICVNILQNGVQGIQNSPGQSISILSANGEEIVSGILDILISPLAPFNNNGANGTSPFGGNFKALSNGGVNVSAELSDSITAFFASPLSFVLGSNGTPGGILAPLDSIRTISGDAVGSSVQAFLQSPASVAATLSGGLGDAFGGILGVFSLPLTICSSLTSNGIHGLLDIPDVLVDAISASLDLTLSGIIDTVSSPVTLINKILTGDTSITGNTSSSASLGRGQKLSSEVNVSADIAEGIEALFESPFQNLIGANGSGGLIGQLESLKSISGEQVGESIETLIESPIALATTLSGSLGLTIGGIVATFSSAFSLSGDIVKGGVDGAANSPSEIFDVTSGNLNLVVQGILNALSSPSTVSNAILNGEFDINGDLGLGANSNLIIETLVHSPKGLLEPLSGGLSEIITGVLEIALLPLETIADAGTNSTQIGATLSANLGLIIEGLSSVASSPLTPLFDLLLPTPDSEFKDSINLGVNVLLESPRETVDTLSGSLGLTLAGVIATISSPLTLSNDIGNVGFDGLAASPGLMVNALSSNLGAIAVGILQTIASPLRISAQINLNDSIDVDNEYHISLPESLSEGVDSSLLSSFKIVNTLCVNIDQTLDAALAVVMSPFTMSGHIFESGGLAAEILFSSLQLPELSATLGDGVAGILNGVSSPLTISALLVNGSVYVDANGNVQVDGGWTLPEIINEGAQAFFKSPSTLMYPLCFAVGETFSGIIQTVSSPFVILYDIFNSPGGVIQGLILSPNIAVGAVSQGLSTIVEGVESIAIYPYILSSSIGPEVPLLVNSTMKALTTSPNTISMTFGDHAQNSFQGIWDGVSSPLDIFKDVSMYGPLGVLKSALTITLQFVESFGLTLSGFLGAISWPLVISAQILSGINNPTSPTPSSPLMPDLSPFPEIPGAQTSLNMPDFSPKSGTPGILTNGSNFNINPNSSPNVLSFAVPVLKVANQILFQLNALSGLSCKCEEIWIRTL